MVAVEIREGIERELERLPVDLQQRVLDFAQALSRPVGVPGSSLLPLAGSITPEDAEEMRQAIEAECERIDADGWATPA